MARPERFELPTTWFVARYSIQLSYGRVLERPTVSNGCSVFCHTIPALGTFKNTGAS